MGLYLLAVTLSTLIICNAAQKECPKPWRSVSSSEISQFTKLGIGIFTQMASQTNSTLPKTFIEAEYFHADVVPVCINAAKDVRFKYSYRLYGKVRKGYFTYKNTKSCDHRYQLASEFVSTDFKFIRKSDDDPVPKYQCSGPWRTISKIELKKFDASLVKDELIDVIRPYAKQNDPSKYCSAGIDTMKVSQAAGCVKLKGEIVVVNGTMYGANDRVVRMWNRVQYKCWKSTKTIIVDIDSTIPYTMPCLWDVVFE